VNEGIAQNRNRVTTSCFLAENFHPPRCWDAQTPCLLPFRLFALVAPEEQADALTEALFKFLPLEGDRTNCAENN
jgi:hypothetical protein